MDNVIYKRRSVRKFDLNKKVSYEILLELCKAASSAPSAKRQQDKEYIIIDDQKIIDEIASLPHGTLDPKDCKSFIAVVGKNPKGLTIPGMEIIDLAMASENILIRATELNIGTCFLGVYPIEDRMDKLNKILNVSNGNFIFGLIAVGYPLESDAFKEWDKFDPNTVRYNR